MRHIVITPDEILQTAPENKQVQRIELNTPGKNKRDYPILVFFNNDKLELNSNQKVVCHYNRIWGKLGYNHKKQLPLAGEEHPEVYQYDLVPSTHHHSDNEDSNHREGKGKGVNRNNSEDDDRLSPINIFIR